MGNRWSAGEDSILLSEVWRWQRCRRSWATAFLRRRRLALMWERRIDAARRGVDPERWEMWAARLEAGHYWIPAGRQARADQRRVWHTCRQVRALQSARDLALAEAAAVERVTLEELPARTVQLAGAMSRRQVADRLGIDKAIVSALHDGQPLPTAMADRLARKRASGRGRPG